MYSKLGVGFLMSSVFNQMRRATALHEPHLVFILRIRHFDALERHPGHDHRRHELS